MRNGGEEDMQLTEPRRRRSRKFPCRPRAEKGIDEMREKKPTVWLRSFTPRINPVIRQINTHLLESERV